MPQQYGLGRGLSSLIPSNKPVYKRNSYVNALMQSESQRENETSASSVLSEGRVQEINVEYIVPNPHQPRKHFHEEKLQELAESIKQHGILLPLIVTKNEGAYEIVAGERRYRAAKIAGLATVPVIVRTFEEQQKLELAIIENVQRHDLNPLEEARAYRNMMDMFQLHQDEVATKVGKSRSSVANSMRLLSLPIEVQRVLEEEKITEGHAKAILSLSNPEKQRALFEVIVKQNLTVRQAEETARLEVPVKAYHRVLGKDPQLKSFEEALCEALGTKVEVKKQGKGANITIHCYSRDDVVQLLDKLK